MDYATALKKVQAVKPKENYMLIRLNYDTQLVLPHKDGLQFLASLGQAEQMLDPYGQPHTISELDRSKLTVSPMSYLEYERYKIAALLNMTVAEVKEMGLQSN